MGTTKADAMFKYNNRDSHHKNNNNIMYVKEVVGRRTIPL